MKLQGTRADERAFANMREFTGGAHRDRGKEWAMESAQVERHSERQAKQCARDMGPAGIPSFDQVACALDDVHVGGRAYRSCVNLQHRQSREASRAARLTPMDVGARRGRQESIS